MIGEEANEAAAERGDESPVSNDYYIVNDDPELRTLDVSLDVRIVLLDWRRCCEKTFMADPERFQDSFASQTPHAGNYRGSFSPLLAHRRERGRRKDRRAVPALTRRATVEGGAGKVPIDVG